MYISEFVVGVVTTLGIEVLLFIVAFIIYVRKEIKR